jgi:hypothetical protein
MLLQWSDGLFTNVSSVLLAAEVILGSELPTLCLAVQRPSGRNCSVIVSNFVLLLFDSIFRRGGCKDLVPDVDQTARTPARTSSQLLFSLHPYQHQWFHEILILKLVPLSAEEWNGCGRKHKAEPYSFLLYYAKLLISRWSQTAAVDFLHLTNLYYY